MFYSSLYKNIFSKQFMIKFKNSNDEQHVQRQLYRFFFLFFPTYSPRKPLPDPPSKPKIIMQFYQFYQHQKKKKTEFGHPGPIRNFTYFTRILENNGFVIFYFKVRGGRGNWIISIQLSLRMLLI